MLESVDMTTKQCTMCKRVLPLTAFSFVTTRARYHARCKECSNAVVREYSRTAKGQAARRRADSDPERMEKHRIRVRAYYQTAKGIETHKAGHRRYEKSPARARSRRRYLASEMGKTYMRNNLAKRRARLNNATPADPTQMVTLEDWRQIVAAAKGTCFYCKKKYKKPTMDHRIPLAKGGLHVRDNLVVACLKCNLSKGAKIVTLF